MKKTIFMLVLLMFTLQINGCNNGNNETTFVPIKEKFNISDKELLEIAYSENKVPEGFYKEELKKRESIIYASERKLIDNNGGVLIGQVPMIRKKPDNMQQILHQILQRKITPKFILKMKMKNILSFSQSILETRMALHFLIG